MYSLGFFKKWDAIQYFLILTMLHLVKGHYFSFALLSHFAICTTVFVFFFCLPSCSHNGINYNPCFVTHSFRANFYLDTSINKHPMYPHFWNSAILVYSDIPHLKSKILRLMFQLLLVDPTMMMPIGQSGAWGISISS